MFRAAQDLASVGRVPYLNDARGLGVPHRLSIPCSVSGTLPNSVRSAVNKCHGDRPPQAPPVSAAPFLARGAGDWRKRCGHGTRCLWGWRTGEEYRPWSLRGGGIRGSQVRGDLEGGRNFVASMEPCFENWDLCSCLEARSCSTMLTRAPSMAVALGRGKREPMAVGSETDLGFDFLSSIPGTCGWRWPSSLGVFQSHDVRGPVSTSRCLTCAGTAKVFNLCPCASFHAMSILWDLGSRNSRPTPCPTLPRSFSSWL